MMFKTSSRILLPAVWVILLVACGGDKSSDGRTVDASAKVAADVQTVPAEVLAAVTSAQPELTIIGAEYLTRDGNEYYDVAGMLSDGSEWELDVTRIDGVWTVVETQRDVGMKLVPQHVAGVLETKFPGWSPNRIIESDQGGGVVIYEFFGKSDDGDDVKIEVKWEQGHAELLINEWVH